MEEQEEQIEQEEKAKKKTNWTLWIILGAILGLLLSCVVGALAGGLAGYYFSRSASRGVDSGRVPSMVPGMPWHFEEPQVPEVQIPDIDNLSGAALIMDVTEGSPADRAGIRVGDLVLAVDGRSLDESYALADAIGEHDPGDTVELTIYRGSRERTVKVTLERHPDRGGETAWLGVGYRTFGGMLQQPETPGRFQFEFPGQGNS